MSSKPTKQDKLCNNCIRYDIRCSNNHKPGDCCHPVKPGITESFGDILREAAKGTNIKITESKEPINPMPELMKSQDNPLGGAVKVSWVEPTQDNDKWIKPQNHLAVAAQVGFYCPDCPGCQVEDEIAQALSSAKSSGNDEAPMPSDLEAIDKIHKMIVDETGGCYNLLEAKLEALIADRLVEELEAVLVYNELTSIGTQHIKDRIAELRGKK